MNTEIEIGTSLKDMLPIDQIIELEPSFGSRKNHHFEIVSRVGYLLGIDRWVFEDGNHPLSLDIFETLEKSRPAKIIRALCMLRTKLEINFLKICRVIQRDYRSIMNMPEYMPEEALRVLEDANINLYHYRNEPGKFMVELNRNIQNRINNCQSLFPEWLAWEYLRDIFVMPNGLTEEGAKRAAKVYYENQIWYPYKAYMNWDPEDNGNILYNDQKFVGLLYQWNGDEFIEWNLVSDVSDDTKDHIYDFIERSDKTVFMVDCENSDPYALCAAINNLKPERLEKIDKIVLYDDEHAASAWESLKNYVDIPIEYTLIERLKDNKSLADIKLAAGTCKEYYQNNVDSFVLVSSDSDYWGLIESIPEADFLVMVEHGKFSPAMREALSTKNIFYCFIDDFYAGDGMEIKTDAMLRACQRILKGAVDLNITDLLADVMHATRIDMSMDEKEYFIKRYLRNRIQAVIDDNGSIKLELRIH